MILNQANWSSKKPSGANMSIENKSERVDAAGRSETEFSRWGWT